MTRCVLCLVNGFLKNTVREFQPGLTSAVPVANGTEQRGRPGALLCLSVCPPAASVLTTLRCSVITLHQPWFLQKTQALMEMGNQDFKNKTKQTKTQTNKVKEKTPKDLIYWVQTHLMINQSQQFKQMRTHRMILFLQQESEYFSKSKTLFDTVMKSM